MLDYVKVECFGRAMIVKLNLLLVSVSLACLPPVLSEEKEIGDGTPQIGGISLLKSGNLRMVFSPGGDFARIDNIESPVSRILKAGVPKENLLLASYVHKQAFDAEYRANADKKALPYYIIQTSKSATIMEVGSYPIKELVDTVAKGHRLILEDSFGIGVKDAAVKIQAACDKEALGADVSQVGLRSIGVIHRTETTLTLLMRGTIDVLVGDKLQSLSSDCTMTIMGVDSFPVYLYVYYPDNGEKDSVEKVVQMTKQIRDSIK